MPLIRNKVFRAAAAALTKLTKQQQIVVYLRVHRQLETEEIAEELKITPADVQRLEIQAWNRIQAATGNLEPPTDGHAYQFKKSMH